MSQDCHLTSEVGCVKAYFCQRELSAVKHNTPFFITSSMNVFIDVIEGGLLCLTAYSFFFGMSQPNRMNSNEVVSVKPTTLLLCNSTIDICASYNNTSKCDHGIYVIYITHIINIYVTCILMRQIFNKESNFFLYYLI